MSAPRKKLPKRKVKAALKRNGWNKVRTAIDLGVHRQTLDRLIADHELLPPPEKAKAGETAEPVLEGSIEVETKHVKKGIPRKGVRRYIVTCAQNNTNVHEVFWRNLLRLAEFYEAEVMVSRYTYNKKAYGPDSVKPGTHRGSDADGLWYDPAIEPHVTDHSVQLAPGLIFCGEMNTLPTAVRPLSGFESYTGRHSGIFPHPKLAMASVATGKGQGTKFNYTTGTVTQRNYLQKKAGLKAQFHHVYGALLVEVDRKGRWWVRQLNATEDGEIYDMNVRVAPDGEITEDNRVEAITWGDIHYAFIDPVAEELSFGEGGVLDTLMPKYQFLHDVLDFRSRMHHDMHNPHDMFWKHAHGYEDARAEVAAVAQFLKDVQRSFCETIVCDSNHDNMLNRWLREEDYKDDPKNAIFFLECQLRVYKALQAYENPHDYHLLENLCFEHGVDGVSFLRADESFIICPEYGHGIECGMHGHLGVDGARGNPAQFAKMGRKANTGHTHRAGIHDGIFTSGLLGLLNMLYNMGPSSWSHSIIVTYANGKRAIYTYWEGFWKAEE